MKALKSIWLSGPVLLVFLMTLSCAVKPRATTDSTRSRIMVSTRQQAVPGSQAPKKEDKARSTAPASAGVTSVSIPKPEENQSMPEYSLGYGDVLEIKFFYHPEYNETIKVRPDGRITLQKVGEVEVIGKTPSELQQLITTAFSEYLVEPEVTVIVRDFGGQECYIMGEVEKPGLVSVTKGMTLLRAIAAAGGPKKNAKLSSVMLIRGGHGQDNTEVTRLDLSLSSVHRDGSIDKDIQAFDVIYVPRTFIADVNNFATQLWSIVLPPVDSWVRFRYWRDWYND